MFVFHYYLYIVAEIDLVLKTIQLKIKMLLKEKFLLLNKRIDHFRIIKYVLQQIKIIFIY
jgi:hypothetical protein